MEIARHVKRDLHTVYEQIERFDRLRAAKAVLSLQVFNCPPRSFIA